MALLGVAPWALGLLHPGWVTLTGLGIQQVASPAFLWILLALQLLDSRIRDL
jgi:hypothetical protein